MDLQIPIWMGNETSSGEVDHDSLSLFYINTNEWLVGSYDRWCQSLELVQVRRLCIGDNLQVDTRVDGSFYILFLFVLIDRIVSYLVLDPCLFVLRPSNLPVLSRWMFGILLRPSNLTVLGLTELVGVDIKAIKMTLERKMGSQFFA